jgi:hypothetical protein
MFSWDWGLAKGVMTMMTKYKPNEGKTAGPKPTAYERARARQTGASIEQLRAEQEAAERMMKLKSEGESKTD